MKINNEGIESIKEEFKSYKEGRGKFAISYNERKNQAKFIPIAKDVMEDGQVGVRGNSKGHGLVTKGESSAAGSCIIGYST